MNDLSPEARRDVDAMNAQTYAMSPAERDLWFEAHPLSMYQDAKPHPTIITAGYGNTVSLQPLAPGRLVVNAPLVILDYTGARALAAVLTAWADENKPGKASQAGDILAHENTVKARAQAEARQIADDLMHARENQAGGLHP